MTTRTDVFFDTNIFINFATSDDTKADTSERTLRIGGIVSIQVLNEFVNVTRRNTICPGRKSPRA